jgi:hypothetical protein
MFQFSQAIIEAIQTSHPQCKLLQGLLTDLSKLEKRSHNLTVMAYKWCSVICKNYSALADGKELLILSLEIGFHHLNPQEKLLKLVHTPNHQKMAEVIFESGNDEAIANLLHAWTSQSLFDQSCSFLTECGSYVAGLHILHILQPFSLRLRRLIIRSIELIGYQGFGGVGIKDFAGFLDSLQVGEEDMDDRIEWMNLFIDIIQSPGGSQQLSLRYWKLLLNLATSTFMPPTVKTYNSHVIPFLKENEEWDKLKYWIGVVCVLWPSEKGDTREKELGVTLVSVFNQNPHAIQELSRFVRPDKPRPHNLPSGGGRRLVVTDPPHQHFSRILNASAEIAQL